jgi:hypothetical protein
MKWRWFRLLLLLIMPFSCIDEISLKVDDVQERLVIEGLLADSLNTYSIRVKTAKNKGIYPVNDALVKVLDDKGNTFVFIENKDNLGGVYELKMKGEVGRSYHLEVLTPDKKMIKSDPYLLVKAPRMNNFSQSVELKTYIDFNGKQVQERNVYVKSDVQFDPVQPKPYLRWRTTGEYEFHESSIAGRICYAKEPAPDLNKLNLYSPNRLAGNTLIAQAIVNSYLDFRFAYVYCFHIQMFSMSESEYLYWHNVGDVLTNDGTLYDPPPGNVKGNLYNVNNKDEQIIGYFSVSGVSFSRYLVTVQSLGGNFVGSPCTYGSRLPQCNDCLVIKNSVLDKPEYWP